MTEITIRTESELDALLMAVANGERARLALNRIDRKHFDAYRASPLLTPLFPGEVPQEITNLDATSPAANPLASYTKWLSDKLAEKNREIDRLTAIIERLNAGNSLLVGERDAARKCAFEAQQMAQEIAAATTQTSQQDAPKTKGEVLADALSARNRTGLPLP
jgi:hypothetical protein